MSGGVESRFSLAGRLKIRFYFFSDLMYRISEST